MTCSRCQAPCEAGRAICVSCARSIRDDVGAGAMSMLARYWERRMMEGRKTDWT